MKNRKTLAIIAAALLTVAPVAGTAVVSQPAIVEAAKRPVYAIYRGKVVRITKARRTRGGWRVWLRGYKGSRKVKTVYYSRYAASKASKKHKRPAKKVNRKRKNTKKAGKKRGAKKRSNGNRKPRKVSSSNGHKNSSAPTNGPTGSGIKNHADESNDSFKELDGSTASFKKLEKWLSGDDASNDRNGDNDKPNNASGTSAPWNDDDDAPDDDWWDDTGTDDENDEDIFGLTYSKSENQHSHGQAQIKSNNINNNLR